MSTLKRRLLPLALLAFGLLALPSAASAANPSIQNTGAGCSGQTSWLISCAAAGETNNNGNMLRISTVVGHDTGNPLASLLTDDDWDSTNDPTTVRSVSAQRPNIASGYPRSRTNLTYTLPTTNTGMSCGFFSGTRRTTDRNARIAPRDSAGQTGSTSSSQIKFTAAGQCDGVEDYAYLYSWGANNFNNSITPGSNVTFTYTGDDPDISGSSDFQGVGWRRRNIRTGAVSGVTVDCDGNGDNAQKSTTVNFPDRGAFVVEAELRDGSGCTDNQNSGFWFPLGTADVNSSAAPTLNLSATRPQINGNTTVSSTGLADPDSGDGGGAQIIEWDLNGNNSDGVGGFEATTVAGYQATLSSPQTKTHSTSGETPGLYTVKARVTDNGAWDAADSIRRTSSVVTAQYLVDTPPTADAQTVDTDTNASSVPITLTGSDTNADGSHDLLTFTHGSPSHGTLSGSGDSLTYTPDAGYAGSDSFTFTANDGFGGTDTATVTINVRPDTTITSQPDNPSPSSSATFEFTSGVTSPPSADPLTFECRIDSTLESDFSPCSSPKSYSGLSDGQHTFEVRAESGSFIDPTPASYTWTLDATPPDTVIDSHPASVTGSSTADFTYHSDDPNANFECKIDAEDFAPCFSSGKSYSDLTEGQHTFQVRGVDQFGRTDPTPASFTWTVDFSVPAVNIDSAPHNPTNETTAEFDFSSTDTNATFECSLDGSPLAACTSPAVYPGLSEGQHTFQVQATNQAGNTSEPVTYTWTIDTTVPETLLDSGPPFETDSSVASFQFSSDDPSAGFQCRLDSADPGDWEECSSPQLYADLSDGFHTFEVRATDDAGNRDATPESLTWQVDSTSPQTTIDSSPDDLTTSTDAEFSFSSDEAGSTFECKLDSQSWEGCTTPKQYTGLAQGEHHFRVRATDSFGNTDPTPAVRTWTIDTTGPTTSIDSGPQDPTSSDAATFQFSADEPGSTFECSLDSAAFAACSSPQTYTNLADGQHTVSVHATDQVGNIGPDASRSWTVDTIAPDVQIDSGPPATTSSSSATFAFSSSDGTADFQCRLDGGSWQVCTSPKTYSGLDDGQHGFDVRAIDPVGNISSPVAHADWTIANSGAPNSSIDSAPGGTTTATDATFSFSSTEPSTFECSIDSGAFEACGSGAASTSGTKSYTGLSVGDHTFSVRATDQDAPPKTDATPASYSWHIVAPPAPPPPGQNGGSGGVAGATAKSPTITPGKGPLKRGRGVAATVDCPSGPCTVAGKATLKIGGRSFTAQVKTSTSLASGQAASVTVVLPKAARTALALAGKGKLTLQVTATAAGAPVTQLIKLKVTK